MNSDLKLKMKNLNQPGPRARYGPFKQKNAYFCAFFQHKKTFFRQFTVLVTTIHVHNKSNDPGSSNRSSPALGPGASAAESFELDGVSCPKSSFTQCPNRFPITFCHQFFRIVHTS
jgi:hypothetical protein